MKSASLRNGWVLVCGILTAFCLCGCEKDPDTSMASDYFDENPYQTAERPPVNNQTSLSVTPTSATLSSDDAVVTLTASGGVEPYSWTKLAGTGDITAYGGSAVYRRVARGDNAVTVTDANGDSVSVTISQP